MKDWKRVVNQVAPTIATALGGPLAGLAVKTLGGALLGDDSASEDDIAKALLDSEGLLKLKQAENDFKVKMKQLDVDVYALEQKDRDSARTMAAATGNTPQIVLSTVFIGGFFLVLYILFGDNIEISDSQENLSYLLLGVLASGVTMILKFWFGGSPHDMQQMNNIYNSIPREQLKK